jgi:hypothetical protein
MQRVAWVSIPMGKELEPKGMALVRSTALDRAVKVGQDMDGSSLRL